MSLGFNEFWHQHLNEVGIVSHLEQTYMDLTIAYLDPDYALPIFVSERMFWPYMEQK